MAKKSASTRRFIKKRLPGELKRRNSWKKIKREKSLKKKSKIHVKNVSNDLSDNFSNDLSDNFSNDALDNMSDNVSNDVSNDALDNMSDDFPEDLSKDSSDDLSDISLRDSDGPPETLKAFKRSLRQCRKALKSDSALNDSGDLLAVFDCLQGAPAVFSRGKSAEGYVQEDKQGCVDDKTKEAKAPTVRASDKPTVKAFLQVILKTLDKVREKDTLGQLLKALLPCAEYFSVFKVYHKRLCAILARIWGGSDEQLSVCAFLALRKTSGSADLVVDAMYKTYISADTNCISENASPLTSSKAIFMVNCIAEVCSEDIAYKRIFKILRTLSAELKFLLAKKSSQSRLMSWKTLKALQLCVKVISHNFLQSSQQTSQQKLQELSQQKSQQKSQETPLNSLQTFQRTPMGSLCHPLAQICLGIMSCNSHLGEYALMNFHISRMLLVLSKSVGVFVPLGHLVAFLTIPQGSCSSKPFNVKTKYKVSQNILKSRVYRKALMEEALILLLEYLAHLSKTAAFPELCLPIISSLKSASISPEIKSQCRAVAERIEATRKLVEEKRLALNCAPRDLNLKKFSEMIPNDTPVFKYLESMNVVWQS